MVSSASGDMNAVMSFQEAAVRAGFRPSQPSNLHGLSVACIEEEEEEKKKKEKVLASVWGEEFIKFLAALAVLPCTTLKNRINSSFSFK